MLLHHSYTFVSMLFGCKLGLSVESSIHCAYVSVEKCQLTVSVAGGSQIHRCDCRSRLSPLCHHSQRMTATTPTSFCIHYLFDLLIVQILISSLGKCSSATYLPRFTCDSSTGILIRLTGQSILRFNINATHPGLVQSLANFLKTNDPDVIFGDMEGVINNTESQAYTGIGNNNVGAVHTGPESILDILKSYGFNIMATSNNHFYDMMTPGLTATLRQMQARSISQVGAGMNLMEARKPAFLNTRGESKRRLGAIGVTSSPTLNIYGGIATRTSPGVNAMQLTLGQTPDPIALSENLALINQTCKTDADLVMLYEHSHFTFVNNTNDADAWLVNWAYDSINAGATLFMGHGATNLKPIDIHNGRLIFYGLGSLHFQSPKIETYDSSAFESLIVDVCYSSATMKLEGVKLTPIVLGLGIDGSYQSEAWYASAGIPSLANVTRSNTILTRLQTISPNVSIEIDTANGIGYIYPNTNYNPASGCHYTVPSTAAAGGSLKLMKDAVIVLHVIASWYSAIIFYTD
jgi:poly-gamma-glutamate capsule biosynthesis protein CapA/YwtB (metallophosphatase superfamily)